MTTDNGRGAGDPGLMSDEVALLVRLAGTSGPIAAERLGSTAKAAESMLTRARVAFRDGFHTLAGSRP